MNRLSTMVKAIGMITLVALLLAMPIEIGAAEMPDNPADTAVGITVASGIPLGEPLPWEPGSVLEIREDELVVHDAPDAINIRELGIERLAEFEALFPPNPDGEFIVHCIPPLPVVIDGVRYEPEDIHLFNGQVLRFVLDDEAVREGVIYAFTTPEGLQRFVEERWGVELFGKERPLLWEDKLAEAGINLEGSSPKSVVIHSRRNFLKT